MGEPLRLRLLGPVQAERDGEPLRGFESRKALALLCYLTLHPEPLTRAHLADMFWPDKSEARGRGNLSRVLHNLSTLIPDCLQADRHTVGFRRPPNCWLDVEAFQELAARGDAESLAAAIDLYRGDLMAGYYLDDCPDFETWLVAERERWHRRAVESLDSLTKHYTRRAEYREALNYARRLLELDPWREEAHRQVMALLARTGRRSVALAQYETCCQVLAEELGVEPGPETTALYEHIRDGKFDTGEEGKRSTAGAFSLAAQPFRTAVASAPPAFLSSVSPPVLSKVEEPPSSPAPFVARECELAQLDSFLDLALAGQGRVVFVTGDAGSGKTALVREFARRALEMHGDIIVASGNCNAHTGIGDPYLPFREILSLVTGDVDALWLAGAITGEHARRLWDTFPVAIQVLMEAGSDLIDTFIPGRVLVRRAEAYEAGGTDGPATWRTQLEELVEHNAAVPHDPNLHQSALFEQYGRVMGALARERPLLLVVDDLQWADIGSIDLLFHLGRGVARERVLIVGGYRPEEVALGRPSASAVGQVPTNSGEREQHPLEPVVHEFQRTFGDITVDLNQAEARRFLEEYLDTEANLLSAGFRETLYRQTRGHPLFTIELLRDMQERGDLLKDKKGRWVEGSTLDWMTLPARVEAAIAKRIGRLDAAAQEALRVASVEGETFSAQLVARVCSTDESEMVERLSGELGRKHRLVVAQEIQRFGVRRLSRYRFRHILFQNYLYNKLDEVERGHLHEAVGTALEDLYGEETREIAVSLARHFQEAGLAEKAIEYLLQAGENAKRKSAIEEAITHLTKGLELLKALPETSERIQRELDLQIALGVALVAAKGQAAPGVEATYARARELCEQIGNAHQLCQVLVGLRRYYLHRGNFQTAQVLGEQLLDLAHSIQDSTYLARAHLVQGVFLYRLGDFAQARDHCEQGVAVYEPQQRRSHLSLFGNDTGIGCRIFGALALWHLGYPDQALGRAQEMLTFAHESPHPFTLIYAHYSFALLQQFLREVGAVQEQVEELLRIAGERKFALFVARGAVLQGWALAKQGKTTQGVAKIQQGLAALRDTGAQLVLPESYAFLAEAYAQAGRTEEGLRLVTEALTEVEKTGERNFEAELYRLKGELLLSHVEVEAKTKAVPEAEVGRCCRDAETCFRLALEVARRQRAKSWELRAVTSLSRLWIRQGKQAEARKMLAETYDWFAEGFDTPDLKEAKALLDSLS